MTRNEYLAVRDDRILFAIKKRRHSKYLNYLFTQAFNSNEDALEYFRWWGEQYFTAKKLKDFNSNCSIYYVFYKIIPRELAEILGTTFYTSITLKDGRTAAIRRRLESLSLDESDIHKERISEKLKTKDYDVIDVRAVMSEFFHELEEYDKTKEDKRTRKNFQYVSSPELFRVLLSQDFDEVATSERLPFSKQRVNQLKNKIFDSIANRIRERFPEFVEGEWYYPTWRRFR